MARNAPSPIDLRVRQARRRLFAQALLNRLLVGWAVALALGVGWFLLEPFAVPNPPPWLRWAVLGGLFALGTAAAVILTIRSAPSRLAAALALDERFGLRERVTTALSLGAHERQSSAGQALLEDANQKAKDLAVRSRFPVRFGWGAAWLPAEAAALVLIALFYQPQINSAVAGPNGPNGPDSAKVNPNDPKNPQANRPPLPKPVIDRANKPEQLRKLEAEAAQLLAQTAEDKQEKPEQAREKIEQIVSLEERMRKFEAERAEKFQRLQEQMQKLGRPDANKMDGPAQQFRDALSKGDIDRARQEVDRLKKKAKSKELTPEDAEKLKKQAAEMAEKLERLSRNQDEQERLQDLINKAKQEGRDAETLERELQRLQQEAEQMKELQDIAKKLGDLQKSLDKGDLEEVAEQLGELSKQLDGLGDMLQDLEDLEEHLQALKQERKRLCGKCQGKGKGENDGEPNEGDYAQGQGRASGKRPENPDARTSSEDARIRGRFDPRGRKTYGGAVSGPAFTKKTTVELSGDIREAVQEGPEAIEVQRLPAAARELVKEYFENLGGMNGPPPKK